VAAWNTWNTCRNTCSLEYHKLGLLRGIPAESNVADRTHFILQRLFDYAHPSGKHTGKQVRDFTHMVPPIPVAL
jgi:hypothetical protein